MILPVCVLNTDYHSFKGSFVFRPVPGACRVVTVFFNKPHSCSLQEGKLPVFTVDSGQAFTGLDFYTKSTKCHMELTHYVGFLSTHNKRCTFSFLLSCLSECSLRSQITSSGLVFQLLLLTMWLELKLIAIS